jgi:hypothetical protein
MEPHHESPVPGSRRTADGVPDGRIASPLPVWASHDRLSIAIGARGMPHRDPTRRLLPLPIIHATSSISSVSSAPHHPRQTRFQCLVNLVSLVSLVSPPSSTPDALPMAAGSPRPLRPSGFAKSAGRRGEGCRPPPTPRETTSTLDFTIGFVSSRSVSSARAHARPTAASLTRPSHDSSHSAPSAVTRPSHYSSHRYGWHRLQRRAYSPQPARPQS